ncbi:MAG: hypothetical protein JST04_00925 [Bdellovibrionales bacterium]|nr:hypothetical protein [Bdellovibrionales bacterium]
MNEFIKKLEPLIDVRKDFKEWYQYQHIYNENALYKSRLLITEFVTLPFILQIGIWIKYLQDNNLQVSVYHRAYQVYYIDNHKITHHQYNGHRSDEDIESDTRVLCSNMDGDSTGYINSEKYYEEAIFKGLEYIDKTIKFPPF